MSQHLQYFNDSINNTEFCNLGLSNGEMGRCIYLFVVGNSDKNKHYVKTAEEIAQKISIQLSSISSIKLKDGLSGIGLGIDYLVSNNYLSGDINYILKPIDDIIYKQLDIRKYCDLIKLNDKILLLIYLYVRLEKLRNKDEKYLFEHLILKIITIIYEKIEETLNEEPIQYTFEYNLPLMLIILSKFYSKGLHKQYISGIINEITPKIISKIPYLNSNKLYLIWGASSVLEHIKIDKWEKHINLLKHEFNVNRMLEEEFPFDKIFFLHGLSSIYYILLHVKDIFADTHYYYIKALIHNNILNSRIWELFEKDISFFNTHKGLLTGFTGTSLLLSYLKSDIE